MKHFKEHSVFLVIFYAWQMYMLLTEEEKAHDTDDEAPKRRLLLATGTDEKHFGMSIACKKRCETNGHIESHMLPKGSELA